MPPLVTPEWCSEMPKVKTWDGSPFARCEVKMDGWSILLRKDGLARCRAMTTAPDDISISLKRCPWWKFFCEAAPTYTAIAGELVGYNHEGKLLRASSVPTCLRGMGTLRFYAYGVPCFDGVLPHRWESQLLALKICGLESVPVVDLAKHGQDFLPRTFAVRGERLEEDRERMHALATSMNVEGFVLKNDVLSQWYKFKRERTVDAFVTGIRGGSGRNKGGIGSLVVSCYNTLGESVEIAAASGLSDEFRAQCEAMPFSELLGRVVEVRYQQVGAGGRLRHPRVVRWREDKAAELCFMTQLEEGR